jgi:hypothetical protein
MNRKQFILALPALGFIGKLFAEKKNPLAEKQLEQYERAMNLHNSYPIVDLTCNRCRTKVSFVVKRREDLPTPENCFCDNCQSKYGIFTNVKFTGKLNDHDICAFNYKTNTARRTNGKRLRKNETIAVRISNNAVQTRGIAVVTTTGYKPKY